MYICNHSSQLITIILRIFSLCSTLKSLILRGTVFSYISWGLIMFILWPNFLSNSWPYKHHTHFHYTNIKLCKRDYWKKTSKKSKIFHMLRLLQTCSFAVMSTCTRCTLWFSGQSFPMAVCSYRTVRTCLHRDGISTGHTELSCNVNIPISNGLLNWTSWPNIMAVLDVHKLWSRL